MAEAREVSPTQEQDPDRHEREGQQRANARELAEHSDRREPGNGCYQRGHNARAQMRRAKAWMHTREQIRQEPVATHAVEDARCPSIVTIMVLNRPKSALILMNGLSHRTPVASMPTANGSATLSCVYGTIPVSTMATAM